MSGVTGRVCSVEGCGKNTPWTDWTTCEEHNAAPPGRGRAPMDACVRVGVAPMARFLRALLKVGGTLTDAFALHADVEYHVRIHLPPDRIDEFRDEAKPVDLRPAPHVGVLDLSKPPEPRRCSSCGAPENNHPYRHPFKAWTPGGRDAR